MASTLSKDVRELDPQQWLVDHGSALYRYAMSKVRRADVAEDLVQETFLAAWRGRDQFRHDSQVRSWLIGILKRKIIDWLRLQMKQQKARSLNTDTWLDDQFEYGGKWKQAPSDWHPEAPDADSMRREFWAVMQSCLDKLPPRLRTAFVLWQLEEQSSDDVCQELGISASNLWVMLHRSRLRLWRCLSTNWYGLSESELTGGPS